MGRDSGILRLFHPSRIPGPSSQSIIPGAKDRLNTTFAPGALTRQPIVRPFVGHQQSILISRYPVFHPRKDGKTMDDPLVFGDMPLSIKVLVIAGAIFIGPYLMVQAWREERRTKA
jgi:hypothetical protein